MRKESRVKGIICSTITFTIHAVSCFVREFYNVKVRVSVSVRAILLVLALVLELVLEKGSGSGL